MALSVSQPAGFDQPVSPKEAAAQYVAVHPTTLKRWEQRGKFPPKSRDNRAEGATFSELDAIDTGRRIQGRWGKSRVALAQTLQFELSLRQKDVIGEWEPAALSEGGIVHKGRLWTNGLQWSDIDSTMILRKTHTKTGAYVEFDLKFYPAVLEEIGRVPREKRVGPMIISERTGEPYKHRTFTQTWRKVADKAGVPKGVWNMDARAGAISEAYDAGAGETDVMKHAGHKNRQTSARYNRGTLDQTSRVARLRLAKRSENKS